MNRYEKIDFDELEDISILGGADDEKDGDDRGSTVSQQILSLVTRRICPSIIYSMTKVCLTR